MFGECSRPSVDWQHSLTLFYIIYILSITIIYAIWLYNITQLDALNPNTEACWDIRNKLVFFILIWRKLRSDCLSSEGSRPLAMEKEPSVLLSYHRKEPRVTVVWPDLLYSSPVHCRYYHVAAIFGLFSRARKKSHLKMIGSHSRCDSLNSPTCFCKVHLYLQTTLRTAAGGAKRPAGDYNALAQRKLACRSP